MEEAADADYVVILDSGKIAAEGTEEELTRSAGKEKFEDAFFQIYKDNHHES